MRGIEAAAAAMRTGPERDAAIREGIERLAQVEGPLGAEDESRLLSLWGQIGNAQTQAGALRLFHERPELLTDGVRAAVVSRADALAGSQPFTVESCGLADILSNCRPFFDTFATDQLDALKRSAQGLPDTYTQASWAKTGIEEELQLRRGLDTTAAPHPVETAAGRQMRGIEAAAAAMRPGPERDAAIREGIERLAQVEGPLGAEDESRLLSLWGQIGNAQTQAGALRLFHERPELLTDGVRAAVVSRAGALAGSQPFTVESCGLADILSNCRPFFDTFATDQLDALKRSAQGLPDTYTQASWAKTGIEEELRRRRRMETAATPRPVETAAGGQMPGRQPTLSPAVVAAEAREARLRGLEASIASVAFQEAWPRRSPAEQSAAMRDAVLSSPVEIDELDPRQQERMFGLLQGIRDPRDWAAAMKRIGPKLGGTTPEFRAAVLRKIRDLSHSPFEDSDRLAVADAVVNCAGPSAAGLTTGELMDLQDSLGRVPHYYAQRQAAELRIGAELYARQAVQMPVMLPAAIDYAVMNGGQESAIGAIESLANPGPSTYPYPPQNHAQHVDGSLGASLSALAGRIEHVAVEFDGRIASGLNAIKHPGNFATAVSGFRAKLGRAGQKVRAAVYDRIDKMGRSLAQQRDYAVEAAVGASIIHCAGPSAAAFTPDQRESLLRHADRLDPNNGDWRHQAMSSLQQGWPGPMDGPSYEETLARVRLPPPIPPNRPQVQVQAAQAGGMAPEVEERLFVGIDRNTDPTAWAEALSSGIGDRFGTVSPTRRQRVLTQIDGLMANNAFAGAAAIFNCVGRSAATLMPGERAQLVGSIIKIDHRYDDAAIRALLSLRRAWPAGRPTFEDELRRWRVPDWAYTHDDVLRAIDTVAEEERQRALPQAAPPPRAATSRKPKQRR